jgi:hypothetical protein
MGESTARSVVERDGTDGAVAELVASGDVRTWRNTDGVPPLFVEPRSDTLASVSDFCDWLERNIQTLNDVVAAEGAVVLRGFPVRDARVHAAALIRAPRPVRGARYACDPELRGATDRRVD